MTNSLPTSKAECLLLNLQYLKDTLNEMSLDGSDDVTDFIYLYGLTDLCSDQISAYREFF